jgi:hypothetical protein
MGGDLVPSPVPGDERDVSACDGPDSRGGRRGPEGRTDVDLLDVVEERIEARSAEDAERG